MTVTIVSGKTLEFSHLWVKYPIVDLPEEHQKVIVEKIKKETSIKNEQLILSDFYYAGGRKWIPGSPEDKHFVTRNGELEVLNEKPEDQNLIISRNEAERILKIHNHYVVWVDAAENVNRRYWLADRQSFKDEYDCLNGWNAWYTLNAKSIIDPEENKIDTNIQMLVHDFYFHGGKEGALKYYDEVLSKIEIPQYAEFYERQKKSWETGLWNDEPLEPEYIKEKYIDVIRSVVHKMDLFEVKKEAMKTETWTDLWRIVHMPTEDAEDTSDDTYYSSGKSNQTEPKLDLKAWLQKNFISQNKAAELCGVTPRTFRRWVAENPPIPKGMWELLKSKITER